MRRAKPALDIEAVLRRQAQPPRDDQVTQVSLVILAWIVALRVSSSIAKCDDDGQDVQDYSHRINKIASSALVRLLAHEWMAIMAGRTLNEMSSGERHNIVSLVVNALQNVAEDAGEHCDHQAALNAIYLACSIRGCDVETSSALRAAELLLEQGISYVASISERFERSSKDADGTDAAMAQPPRILH